ncbi:hypothetical protein JCM8097_001521 [Rhodosporidiobolus ruineniae]
MNSNCLATQLPPELLSKIFRLVRRLSGHRAAAHFPAVVRGLADLTLVCRAWHPAAKEELYRIFPLSLDANTRQVVVLKRAIWVEPSLISQLKLLWEKLPQVWAVEMETSYNSEEALEAVANLVSGLGRRLTSLKVDGGCPRAVQELLTRLPSLTSYTQIGLYSPRSAYLSLPRPPFRLQSLVIVGETPTVYLEWLAQASSSSLSRLFLATFLGAPHSTYDLSPFSRLSHLTLTLNSLDAVPAFRATLSSTSSLTGLRSLHLHQNLWRHHPPVPLLPRLGIVLAPLAPSLRTLELDSYLFRPDEVVAFLDSRSSCPELHDLVLGRWLIDQDRKTQAYRPDADSDDCWAEEREARAAMERKAEERGVRIYWWRGSQAAGAIEVLERDLKNTPCGRCRRD